MCIFAKMAYVTEKSFTYHPNQFCTTIGITSVEIPLVFLIRGFDDLYEMQKENTVIFGMNYQFSEFSVDSFYFSYK